MISRSSTVAPSAARAPVGIISAAALAITLATTLAPCSTPGAGDARSANSSSSTVTIVASTNVWGSIAKAIAGENAKVTSLISSESQDPHSFEATAGDQLGISRAEVGIVNGGGYDTFKDNSITGAGSSNSTVIDASVAAQRGFGPSPKGADGFNEHLWYSFDAVGSIAQDIADELRVRDPANAADYVTNCDNFRTRLDGLKAQAAEIRATFGGDGAAITEPLPLYLLEAAGLINRTPAAFSTAFEEGIDVSPLAMRDTIALLNSGSVSVFVYNEQTVTTQGEQIRNVARKAGIPVVAFAETLPSGEDYVSWMTANLNDLSAALRS